MSPTNYFNDRFGNLAGLDRFFDDVFNSRVLRRVQDVRTFRPRMDVHYDKDTNDVSVAFELPGLQEDDVSIDVHNGILIVSGGNQASSELSEGGYVVRERRYGKFTRSLALPQDLKNDDIKASMANGGLTIIYPGSTPDIEQKNIVIA